MPFFESDGVRLHYLTSGDPDGFPVLLIAPGGMRSAHSLWTGKPWDPMTRLGNFHVIAMDQRNAGSSTAPVSGTDGWEVYTRDQLALLDHLGIEHFHGVGMCIGGPYLFGLIRAAPERVRSAVMLQPIGLRDNREAFFRLFDAWAAELAPIRTETTEQDWLAFRSNMFGGDFVFNATREEVAACPTPLLILRGNDLYHPEAISREIASLAPNARLVEHWKDEPALGQADQTIRSFLRQWSESPSG